MTKINKLLRAQKWLDFAWEDLRVIDGLIEEDAFGLACFHAHQAIEKSLKSFLVYQNKGTEKVHALIELLEICKKFDKKFGEFEDYVLIIDRYYIPTRYPDAAPGSLPEGMPQKEHAEEALKMAKEIFDFVKKLIK